MLGGPLPPYRHDRLWECFDAAIRVAKELLSELTKGPEYVVPLVFDGAYFAASLDKRFFEGKNHYYLLIKADLTPREIERLLTGTGKVCSLEEMEVLRQRALPGLDVRYLEAPPEELPRRGGWHYFELAGMYNVPELFSELFAYVLLFEQMSLQGAPLPSYDEVRSTIAVILGRQEAYAKHQGMREQEYHNALFAIVAWADETILQQTHWTHHHQWSAYPLQLEYSQTMNAGEELFERLQTLHADQTEVREIYYLCLGLGFSGQYFLGIEDELKLNQIRHEQARYLSLPIEDVRDVARLIPQPYEVTPPEGKPIKTPLLQYWLKGGIILIAAIPLLLLLILALLPI